MGAGKPIMPKPSSWTLWAGCQKKPNPAKNNPFISKVKKVGVEKLEKLETGAQKVVVVKRGGKKG